jgi:amidase
VECIERVARQCEALGHSLVEDAPSFEYETFLRAICIGWTFGFDVEIDELEPLNRALRDGGRQVSSVEYEQAVFALGALARRTVAFWQDRDLLLTPTLALPPVPIGWTFGGDPWDEFERGWLFTPFTQIANLTGQPAISLPLYRSDGLPIGVQLIGPPAGEALLVRVAAQLEEARPWQGLRPPLTA